MQNVVQFPVTRSTSETTSSKGWSYLLAESLAFKKDMDFGIRVQKPEQEQVPQWIQKIIEAGQCQSLYVENLSLTPEQQVHIEKLCLKHRVSLFSVSKIQNTSATQVN